ncbi:MAG TPA: glycoside hydrolase 43 family protein [Limnochordia bacterium]|nr:glycoside hydrolase 43 family protein [Limnochordia bacterium]
MAVSKNAQNPVIWADVPDPSVIRVGDTYYMTSTTMHVNPGVPIMKSKDLVNWEIVNYVYDILGGDDRQRLVNGQNEYGRGSWASSLRYYDGTFYVLFSSQTAGHTFIFRTNDIENGPWEKTTIRFTHDMSLLIDDDQRAYLVYGGGDIRLLELTEDLRAVKPDGLDQVIIPNSSEIAGPVGLPAEGAHIHKINGKYYIFLITWPRGGMRTQLCYRADHITGPYEGRVVLRDAGIAQGGLVDTPDGNWYALLFGDRGAVGRIPYLVPVRWEDDWPVLGIDGKVPQDTGISVESKIRIVASDEFDQKSDRIGAYHTVVEGLDENDYNGSNLDLVWQWNHNPDNNNWSLTERPGYLRLRTGHIATSITDARNTLTQRTFGPECSAVVALEVNNMQDGDYAGLAALQKNYGFVAVKMTGSEKTIVMVDGTSETPVEVESVKLTQDRVYFKVECDFREQKDTAYFYYSLDGSKWTAIGRSIKMSYTIPHFMGYRFALFNYASENIGGYVDFDYYRISDKMTGTEN